jgi:hypothetical protein
MGETHGTIATYPKPRRIRTPVTHLVTHSFELSAIDRAS